MRARRRNLCGCPANQKCNVGFNMARTDPYLHMAPRIAGEHVT